MMGYLNSPVQFYPYDALYVGRMLLGTCMLYISSNKTGVIFRDDDDINDVASMAGVNLSEENARILATNSELVGTQTRSCKDDVVANVAVLQRRMTEIGEAC